MFSGGAIRIRKIFLFPGFLLICAQSPSQKMYRIHSLYSSCNISLSYSLCPRLNAMRFAYYELDTEYLLAVRSCFDDIENRKAYIHPNYTSVFFPIKSPMRLLKTQKKA